jgi:hypothetical protein
MWLEIAVFDDLLVLKIIQSRRRMSPDTFLHIRKIDGDDEHVCRVSQ